MTKRISVLIITLCISSHAYTQEYPVWGTPTSYTPSTVNKITAKDAVAPIATMEDFEAKTVRDVKQTTQFFDGLGRPLQIVVKQGSPLGFDVTSTNIYDALGRESKKYLPFVSAANTGDFNTDPFPELQGFYNSQLSGQNESFFYGKTVFEATPENRPTISMPPGISWAGSDRGTEAHYFNNTSNDVVFIFNVIDGTFGEFGTYYSNDNYPAGTLIKTITKDEQGNQVIEFKNKSGQVILKKVQLTALPDDGSGADHDGWLCTYYVYDNIGNLRLVLPPKATNVFRSSGFTTTMLDELCFRYEYDERNRMMIKQVPGAHPVYMIYDQKDRLVLTQDGNLANKGQWLYTLYDNLNRPVETGLWDNTDTWSELNEDAQSTPIYPDLTGRTYEIFTQTFYDDYEWISGISGTPFDNTRDHNDDDNFSDNYSQWPYPRALDQSTAIKGMATGSKVKILGTNDYLYSINYYDDRGRVIQQQSTNITGGKDISTTQYSFSGQPLMNILNHHKAGAKNPQSFIVGTKTDYDEGGRPVRIDKLIINEAGKRIGWKTISRMKYDELGQLLIKGIGNTVALSEGTTAGLYPSAWTPPLINLGYEYNIRGWLLGVNRGFVNGNSTKGYFGFELAYDKTASTVLNSSYVTPAYNGNIAGTIWKMKGDLIHRKYDFVYDNANRLLRADYLQQENSWRNDNMNFSVKMGDGIDPLTAYDENGNIKRMQQWGYKVGGNGNTKIDDLAYLYKGDYEASNKLDRVTDSHSDPLTKLGDFKDGDNGYEEDYSYDVNGNLNKDENKAISEISYNYLNLPHHINVTGKGAIEYVYDATGNKLQKIVHDNTTGDKTTTYIAGFVYENDTLQLVGHEEGRIRYRQGLSTDDSTFMFDYFLKDHLGNVRMVLTEQQQTDIYPAATLEDNAVATEDNYYSISNSGGTIESTPQAIANSNPDQNYPNNNGISNNNPQSSPAVTSNKMYKLNGTYGGKIGLGITLKVMAGDKLNIFGKSYYNNNSSSNLPNLPVQIPDLLSGFLGSPLAAASTASHGTVTSSLINTTEGTAGIITMLQNQYNESLANPTIPNAYINYIFFDEQFKYAGSGFSRVGTNGNVKDHYTFNNVFHDIAVPKNGFVYIYCSNQSPIDVYFDNLQVVHTRSPILEDNSYYPFGLMMAGISSKAAGSVENKRKFNKGSELQSGEFSDGSGLELYATNFRSLDPQLGRWWQIDPKPDYYQSPYCSMNNNPILFNDPLGDVAVFYNDEGKEIYRRKDGHKYITPTIISDDKLKAFNSAHAKGKGTLAGLQGMGTTYDTRSVFKFFDANKNKFQANYIKTTNIEKATSLSINGKSVNKLPAEATVNTVLNNGVVSIGKNAPTTDNSMTGANPDKPGDEPGKTGNAHLHPFDKVTDVSYKIGTSTTSERILVGPSEADHDTYDRSGQGTRFIMVDNSNIYLYNGQPGQTITIPRQ